MDQLQPEKLKKLNQRHFRGALIRSGTSILMWLFTLLAFLLGHFKTYHFVGATAAVLFLVLMNPPMLLVMKHIKNKQLYDLFSFFTNQLEIMGYTAVIYFAGGIEAAYLTLFYGSLVTYVGVVTSRKHSIFVASLCIANYSIMAGLVHFGILPNTQLISNGTISGLALLLQLSTIMVFLYIMAYISATSANTIRMQKNKLQQQNVEMANINDRLRKEIIERKHTEEENKSLQAQLQRAQKMEAIGTLAGGVAHDLNNILVGLVSYPELVLMEIPQNNPLRNSILTIQKSGEKVAAIVQDLLTLSRRELNITEVLNLNTIITEYLNSPEYHRLASGHPDIQLETRLEKNLLNVLGSPIHLSKTIMNLVSNAIDAMPVGGKITLSTENRYVDAPIKGYDQIRKGDYIILTISDTGIGISLEDMDKIFEPFYTKKALGKNGTGLGMTVVWGTVKDHEGYIDVQSEEGKGTQFVLYLPVTRKELHIEKSPLSIEEYLGNGKKVLVVDDDEFQREIASKMLSKLGYCVSCASSGEKAIDYMKGNTTDLLILDMIMDPGMDGLETYKQILKIHPGQKAIITSGFSETDRVLEAQKLGVGAYIRKPYILEKIGLAVRNQLTG